MMENNKAAYVKAKEQYKRAEDALKRAEQARRYNAENSDRPYSDRVLRAAERVANAEKRLNAAGAKLAALHCKALQEGLD
jgi:(p)ppGpp synthase/HD superfamily hydrolase